MKSRLAMTGSPGDRSNCSCELLPARSNPLQLLFFAIALMVMLVSCGEESTDAEQIRTHIESMEVALETGDRQGFMAFIAEDFVGNNGMDRNQLNGMLLFQLRRFKDLSATLGPVSIEVLEDAQPPSAEVGFQVLATGGAGWLPERGQLYRVDSQWRKTEDAWLLIAAQWQPTSQSNR